jgi:cytochrome P450 family 6
MIFNKFSSTLESLRIFPPVFQIIRQSARDYKVAGSDLTIPKGTTVMVPVYCFQNDPEYYPEPEKFDPERFRDENSAKRHPMTFMPFGE